jgi:hypothetical protein
MQDGNIHLNDLITTITTFKKIKMKLIKQIALLLLVITGLVLSCKKKDYSLTRLPDKSEINMEVKQDLTVDPGGNTVYLINHTDKVEPVWDYATGKSTRRVDTVHYAFKGDYIVRRSAVTQGGIVNLDSIIVHVTKDNLNYVNDPLWTALTGGVGQQKVWLLDLDANGVSKFFDSPVYFAGDDYAWGGGCAKAGGNCWTWFPKWSDNTWIANKADYGSMTFNLKGGPFVIVDQKATGNAGLSNGTFYLDKDAKTISFSGVTPLNQGYDQVYTKGRIISLTDNTMQIAFKHPSKAEEEVFNYISKSYSDSWTPPPPAVKKPDDGFNPTFAPGEILKMLAGAPSSPGRFWTIDVNGNPVDWIAKGNGWSTDKNSSYNWGWNETWDAAVNGAWIRFDNSMNYSRFQNGTVTTGTFSIDESKNEVTLVGNTLLQNSGSWMNPTTTTIKIVKGWPSAYSTKGVWFGTSYDAGKDEWLSFHYIIP